MSTFCLHKYDHLDVIQNPGCHRHIIIHVTLPTVNQILLYAICDSFYQSPSCKFVCDMIIICSVLHHVMQNYIQTKLFKLQCHIMHRSDAKNTFSTVKNTLQTKLLFLHFWQRRQKKGTRNWLTVSRGGGHVCWAVTLKAAKKLDNSHWCWHITCKIHASWWLSRYLMMHVNDKHQLFNFRSINCQRSSQHLQ